MMTRRSPFALLAALSVAMAFLASSSAQAKITYTVHWQMHDYESNTSHAVIEGYDDENDYSVFWYVVKEADGTKYYQVIDEVGNPNPDDSAVGSSATTEELVEEIEELAKQLGGETWEEDFWKSPAGLQFIQGGDGPVPVTDPWDFGSLTESYDGLDAGGAGGFDLNGDSLVEQLKRQGTSSGDDDDEEGGDTPPPDGSRGLDYPADPALVNPVPEDYEVLQLGLTLLLTFP